MTSRERILAAIHHEPVDRLPIDFGGTRQSGIAAVAYDRLRRHLGFASDHPVRVFDVFQMLAEIELAVADRFGADCVGLYRPAVAFGIPNEDWKHFRLAPDFEVEVPGGFNPIVLPDGGWRLDRDGTPIGLMPAGGFYFDRLERYPGATHPDLATWEPPRLSAADLEHLSVCSRLLYSTTDKAIIAPLGPPFELFNGLGQGGFEQWMMTFASEPDYVRGLYRKLTDAWLENLEAFHGAVGDRIHVLQIADDFGTQRAPFLSVRAFRDLVMPAYRRGLDWIHQRTAWKVMLHSDGALFPLLPSLVEMGVDILNPVQTSAAGMDAKRLKTAFGNRLVFWGGSCDPQTTLAAGTPRDVELETAANVAVLGAESGFVCASVHNIQATVPPANIVAMFDAALNWRVSSSASA